MKKSSLKIVKHFARNEGERDYFSKHINIFFNPEQ